MRLCPSCPDLYNCQRGGCRGKHLIEMITARLHAEGAPSPHKEVHLTIEAAGGVNLLAQATAVKRLAEAKLAEVQMDAIRGEPLAVQVSRLDVENGDILVLRTAEKLTQEKSDDFHDRLLELAQRHGVRNVTVVILDGCTDLSIERPGTATAHQRPRDVPQAMG